MLRKHFGAAMLATLLVVSSVNSATTKYDIDAAHSNVGFAVSILDGLSKVRGKFTDFNVSIVYDDTDVTKSTVNAVIKTASIDTGIERRDAHLRTPDFFDAEKFPEITFQSKRVEKKGNQLVAHGTFTMHGVSKEITLPFTITGVSKDPKDGGTTLGVKSNLTVKRSDYGMTFSNPQRPNFLSDAVEIELDLITRAAKPATATATQPTSGRN